MLVLSRKRQEAVVVGGLDGIERMLKVTVLDIRGSCVRLGFEVDNSVPVHRLEVWERILAGNLPARAAPVPPMPNDQAPPVFKGESPSP